MKNFIIGFIVVVAILVLNSDFMGGRKIKTFSVTADTNVSQVKGLSKYVTQEEVDDFAFRYWDIDADDVQNNDKMENLRQLLKSKNTQEILAYMKDNNISVDEPLHYGVTALMYASFYDDINTAKELLNLGADPHKKDKYKLSPMAYAIENNATKSVKLLYDNGVKFDEVEIIQNIWHLPNSIHYNANFGIESIVAIDGDAKVNYYKVKERLKPPFYPIYFFKFVVNQNLIEIAKMVLESGYKPYMYGYDIDDLSYTFEEFFDKLIKTSPDDIRTIMGYSCSPKPDDILFDEKECLATIDFRGSIYRELKYYPNYEPMLELLLKHNLAGQPKPAKLRSEYEDCYQRRVSYINEDTIEINVNLYQKHCSKPNKAFKDTRAFIAYLNEDYKIQEIYSFLHLDETRDRVYFSTEFNEDIKQKKQLNASDIFRKYVDVIGKENMQIFVKKIKEEQSDWWEKFLKKRQELAKLKKQNKQN